MSRAAAVEVPVTSRCRSGSARAARRRAPRLEIVLGLALLLLGGTALAQSSDLRQLAVRAELPTLAAELPRLAAEPLPSVDAVDEAVLAAPNPTGALLVADRVRRGGAYVLPPNAGSVTPTNVTFNDNIAFCANMRSLQAESRALSERLAQLILDAGPADAELDALRAQSDARDLEAAASSGYIADRRAAREIEDEIDDLLWQRDDLLDNECTPRCPADVTEELDELAAALNAATAELDATRQRADEREAAYRVAVAERDRLDALIADLEAAMVEQRSAISALHDQVGEMYAAYAALEGGSIDVDYDSRWDEAIARLRADHPELWWEPIPTQAARVHLSLVAGLGTDAYLATLPAVLGYSLDGVGVSAPSETDALPSFPKALALSAKVSLVGACVLDDVAAFDIETALSGLPQFTLTVSYEYPSVSPYDLTVAYNPYSLHRLLASDGQLGPGDSARLLEMAKAAGAISFAWPEMDEVDPSRQHFERVVLAQLVARWRGRVGTPVYGRSGTRAYFGAPPALTVVAKPRASAELELRSVSGRTPHEAMLRELQADTMLAADALIPSLARLRTPANELGALLAEGPSALALDRPAPTPRLTPVAPLGLLRRERASTLRATPQLESGAVATGIAEDAVSRRSAPVLDGLLVETAALRRAQLSGIERLVPADRVVALAALDTARRANDAGCGWFHLDCAGLDWSLRGIDDALLASRFDHTEVVHFGTTVTSFRAGAAVFNPGASGAILAGPSGAAGPPAQPPSDAPTAGRGPKRRLVAAP